jgi:hypothetical protein
LLETATTKILLPLKRAEIDKVEGYKMSLIDGRVCNGGVKLVNSRERFLQQTDVHYSRNIATEVWVEIIYAHEPWI